MVSENRTLLKLSLRNNGLTDGDGHAIYSGVSECQTLTDLDLSNNHFSETEWIGHLIGKNESFGLTQKWRLLTGVK